MTSRKPAAKPKARIVFQQAVYEGFFKIFQLRIEQDLHDGGVATVDRLMMDRGHAVAVLAYDPRRDEVLLVNEMRPGLLWAGDDPFTDNLIAGGIAAGENAIDAAVRETEEEAGLVLSDPILVHPGAYVSSGGTSEKIAIVVGIVDMGKAGGIHGCADEQENIKSVIFSADEFIRQVENAEITDLKTLVAGYWLKSNREELRARYGASGPSKDRTSHPGPVAGPTRS